LPRRRSSDLENMESTLEQMWEYAQSITDDEDDPDPDPPSFKKISPEKIEKTVEKIEQKIKNNPKASSKAKAKLRYIKKNYSTNLKRYQEQEKNLCQRSRYSKTDTDATYMQMKNDNNRIGIYKSA